MVRDGSTLAIQVCNRHLGIGCDSLIAVLPSDKADIGMRTFDADGSEAETCGNGIRCIARYVLEKGIIPSDIESLTIETQAAVNIITFERENGRIVKFWANMRKPGFKQEQIPVDFGGGNGYKKVQSMLVYPVEVNGRKLKLNLVSMGNPHAVHFCDGPVASFPMAEIGPVIENLPIFPHRVNFEIARILDSGHIEARVWERGVGETQACGSGTCAITIASRVNGLTGDMVEIILPGGVLQAKWNGSGDIILGGPAEIVFEGVWPD
jgi:diaminopimelate epimerase